MAFLFNNDKSKLETVYGTNPLINIQRQEFDIELTSPIEPNSTFIYRFDVSEFDEVDLTNYKIIGINSVWFVNSKNQNLKIYSYDLTNLAFMFRNDGTENIITIEGYFKFITIKK